MPSPGLSKITSNGAQPEHDALFFIAVRLQGPRPHELLNQHSINRLHLRTRDQVYLVLPRVG